MFEAISIVQLYRAQIVRECDQEEPKTGEADMRCGLSSQGDRASELARGRERCEHLLHRKRLHGGKT